ncbi:MAG TPA: YeeE/YedE thiosulfate transporter family protein [Bradyrhizobium sp.]|nr:YeeE/YedE thiosulfate transporter family protein [Bradyrhizobium sp.]
MTPEGNAGAHLALSQRGSQTPGCSPASVSLSPGQPAVLAALIIVLALGTAAFVLHAQGHAALSLSVIFGAVFGIVLQRSRFCFFCMFRDWYDEGDPRGLLGLLVALAVGIVGYTVVFGAWLPDAMTGRLPPDAFIGPVSGALVLAGLAFGAGMAISGSCVSAHLYRLGEGSPTAPFALAGTVAGFALGFLTWNTIYLAAVADAPVVWLPRWLGYAGAMLTAFAPLILIAWALTRTPRKIVKAELTDPGLLASVFVHRWPAWIGGAVIGALGTASYLRVAPLGVTAEIGSRARQAANAAGILPERLQGLDTLRGCIGVARDVLLSANGAFVLALIAASFAAALAASQFKPSWPGMGQILRGLIGGVLLGWGAMTGLGCTVGTLLSGIMAGALSGWIFGAAVFAGAAATLWIGRRSGLLSRP